MVAPVLVAGTALSTLLKIRPVTWKYITDIVRTICFLLGVKWVGTLITDVSTGTSSKVEIAKSEAIQAIEDNPDYTEEQKERLILKYLETSEPADTEEIIKQLTTLVIVVAAAYFASMFIKK